MRAYLYTGTNRKEDLVCLATSVASLQLPTFVVSFGESPACHPLAPHTADLPLDLVHIRLPGLGLPRGCPPADEMTVQAALAVLRQMIKKGGYQLVVLDEVRETVTRQILTVADLQRLVRAVPDDTEIAMT